MLGAFFFGVAALSAIGWFGHTSGAKDADTAATLAFAAFILAFLFK